MKDFFKEKKNRAIVSVVAALIILIVIIAGCVSCNDKRNSDIANGKDETVKATESATVKNENTTAADKIGQDETQSSAIQHESATEKIENEHKESPTETANVSKEETRTESATETVTNPYVAPAEPQSDSAASTEPSKPAEKPTEPVKTPEPESVPDNSTVPQVHTHFWEAVKEVVHHEAVSHIEGVYVVDQAAYDENIYKRKIICKQCGAMFDDVGEVYVNHVKESNGACGSYRTEKVLVDVIHHEEEGHYEEKKITDVEAYDETVIVGYKCVTCGERRD